MSAALVESITVDMKKYEQAAKDYEEDLIASSIRRIEQARAAKHDPAKLAARARKHLGPSKSIDRLEKGDVYAAHAVLKALINLSLKGEAPPENWDELFKLRSDILSWEEVAGGETPEKIKKELSGLAKERIDGTKKNAQKLLAQIQAATRRMRVWQDPPVVIKPSGEPKEDVAESFYVTVGKRDAGFTVFTKNGKVDEIDDVLEAGDPDFFKDTVEQLQYFDLVRELKSPGSTKRRGRPLTLWTARPVRDRRRYMGARTVPTNIFLTTDPDRAVGISRELGGGRARDVWKIVIDDNHLVQTLKAGHIRDYQVVGKGDVPVKKLVLDIPGEA